MTNAQEAKLRQLCTRYEVEFNPDHYLLYPDDSWIMPEWVEGWVGGREDTLYIGVSPEGDSHS